MLISIFRNIPLFLSLAIFVFPIILFTIATSAKHVHPWFPYVSDLGIVPPEASLFTFTLCFGACFVLLFSLIRYDLHHSHMKLSIVFTLKESENENENDAEKSVEGDDKENADHLMFLAKCSLFTSTIVWVGFLLIGSFRNNEILGVQIMHNIAAGATFSLAVVDVFIEMLIARCKRLKHKVLRLYMLLLVLFVFGSIHGITGGISFIINELAFKESLTRLFWRSGDAAFELHIVSTVTEWIFIYLIGVYFCTFRSMFKKAIFINKAPQSNESAKSKKSRAKQLCA